VRRADANVFVWGQNHLKACGDSMFQRQVNRRESQARKHKPF
jgi:hypothetical protein